VSESTAVSGCRDCCNYTNQHQTDGRTIRRWDSGCQRQLKAESCGMIILHCWPRAVTVSIVFQCCTVDVYKWSQSQSKILLLQYIGA